MPVVLQVEWVELVCKDPVDNVDLVDLQDKMEVLADQELQDWRVNKDQPALSVYVEFQDLMVKRV